MYHERRVSKKGSCFSRVLFIFILFAAITICIFYIKSHWTEFVSPLAEDHEKSTSLMGLIHHEKDPDELKEKVKAMVGNVWNNYSVYVVDYKSPFTMGINESTIFTGASVNKVPILAAVYAEAKKGNVDFNKVITLQQDDIQDYGTGSIRYDPPGTTYSVKTLARLMMQKSDNTAAHLLALYIIGLDVVQKYVNGWGMTQTDMANNLTSNKDMEILFRKIMNGQISTPALNEEMLGFLKDSDFEDRIPALLPKDAVVYHKVGTGTGTVHDVGVVVYGNTEYYIGIFTDSITDEEQASSQAAQLSKMIFDYMK